MNFFSQYPIVKWILIGFGILYFLDKYGIFSPVDNLINRIKKYKFNMHSHLNNPKLQELIVYYNKEQFSNVAQSLKMMNASYRAFAFKSLGQYGAQEVSDIWLDKEPHNDLPKIIKGYQLIHKAWEIRGRGTSDTVSNQNRVAFRNHLKQAEALLVTIDLNSSWYATNCTASLLKIYKAIEVNRSEVHQLFQTIAAKYPDDIELHFNYFAFVSPKWGATDEEQNNYLSKLNSRAPFIQNLILAQYYFDLVHLYDYKDEDKKIAEFIESFTTVSFDSDALFQYELYLLLYWLSNNLNLKDLEQFYKNILEPYWED